MGGPGVEFRYGRGFPHPSTPVSVPNQLPVQHVRGLFTEVNRPELGVDHPSLIRAEAKETVQLTSIPSLWLVACSWVNIYLYRLLLPSPKMFDTRKYVSELNSVYFDGQFRKYCISVWSEWSKVTFQTATAVPNDIPTRFHLGLKTLTLNLLTWKIWWAPNNASRWQMGFNSAYKGLISKHLLLRVKDQNMSYCMLFERVSLVKDTLCETIKQVKKQNTT